MFKNDSDFPVPYIVGDEVVLVAPGGWVADPIPEIVSIPQSYEDFPPAVVSNEQPEPVLTVEEPPVAVDEKQEEASPPPEPAAVATDSVEEEPHNDD
jgi:hypothetical protein